MKRVFRFKRAGLKKFLVDCNEILRVLEEEGPCGCRKLRERTNIPRMTIDRRLSFLENLRLRNLGLITRKDRKWMLVTHVKTYKNSEEYKIHLEHSKEILKGLIAIYHFVPQIPPLGDLTEEELEKFGLKVMPELWPYALQHLKTGYPDILKTFEQFSAVMEEMQNVLDELEQETITERRQERRRRIAEIREKLSGLDVEKFDFMNELNDQIMGLILKVTNKEPLNGVCSLCPKVKIDKTQNE